MITRKEAFHFSIVGIVMFLTLLAIYFVPRANANPTFFLRAATNSGFASTTVVFQPAGTATTTLVLDLGAGGAQAADSAFLTQQFIGSTTLAKQNIVIEYSQGAPGLNCVTAETTCDWYYGLATTTLAVGIRSGGLAGVSSTTFSTLVVPTPTRYVRAVFTVPGTVNGAFYAELTAKRQGN